MNASSVRGNTSRVHQAAACSRGIACDLLRHIATFLETAAPFLGDASPVRQTISSFPGTSCARLRHISPFRWTTCTFHQPAEGSISTTATFPETVPRHHPHCHALKQSRTVPKQDTVMVDKSPTLFSESVSEQRPPQSGPDSILAAGTSHAGTYFGTHPASPCGWATIGSHASTPRPSSVRATDGTGADVESRGIC